MLIGKNRGRCLYDTRVFCDSEMFFHIDIFLIISFVDPYKQRASNGENSSTARYNTEHRLYFFMVPFGNHYSKGYVPKYFFS